MERNELLQSPPISESTNNRYKRTYGSKSSKRKSSPKRKAEKENSAKRSRSREGGLGLINVNPIIDKQIDGVYDLDVVNVQRRSYEDGGTI